jgi:hypothetical protein
MVDERESPSAGWREVYHEMEADAGIEEATHRCPDCGRTCENVARDVYDCGKHGLFRAFDDGETSPQTAESDGSGRDENEPASGELRSPDAEDPDETANRARWSAGPV